MLCILADPTLTDLPLVGTPWPTFIILFAYGMGVKIIGPVIMKSREPINPKTWINCYNVYQIVTNLILSYLVSYNNILSNTKFQINRPIL